jgi:hypothetical protein
LFPLGSFRLLREQEAPEQKEERLIKNKLFRLFQVVFPGF